jgi:hypothetical protein
MPSRFGVGSWRGRNSRREQDGAGASNGRRAPCSPRALAVSYPGGRSSSCMMSFAYGLDGSCGWTWAPGGSHAGAVRCGAAPERAARDREPRGIPPSPRAGGGWRTPPRRGPPRGRRAPAITSSPASATALPPRRRARPRACGRWPPRRAPPRSVEEPTVSTAASWRLVVARLCHEERRALVTHRRVAPYRSQPRAFGDRRARSRSARARSAGRRRSPPRGCGGLAVSTNPQATRPSARRCRG